MACFTLDPWLLQVPSGFYLTDSLIRLDVLMGRCLLLPTTGQTKQDVAGVEAKRIKKLMGSLRHLFRNWSSLLCFTQVLSTKLYPPIWFPMKGVSCSTNVFPMRCCVSCSIHIYIYMYFLFVVSKGNQRKNHFKRKPKGNQRESQTKCFVSCF